MSAPDPFVGKVLQQRYEVLERLAEGAMGVVYRGVRLTLQRPVAIKFLHPAVAQQANLRKRFEVEARAMGLLAHPNCVSVIDFGVEDVPYLVMDFVDGQSLRDTMNQGPLGRDRSLNVARQLLTGLVHAHAQGIIHRDIKPENMILEQSAGLEDHVRVLDFGMARIANAAEGLTAGMVLGTPNYMAPEQAQDTEIDARADLYSAAIVIFEMLTGKQPFAGDSVGEVLRRQLTEPAPKLREIAPHGRFSSALEAVLQKAMAKPPGERFATAQAMLDALEQVPELQGKASVASVLAVEPTALARSVPAPHNLPAPPGGAKPPPAPPDPTQWDPELAQRVQNEAHSPAAHQRTMVLSEDDKIEDDNAEDGNAEDNDIAQPWRRRGRAVVAAGTTLFGNCARLLQKWAHQAAKRLGGLSPPWRYGLAGALLSMMLLVIFFATRNGSTTHVAPGAEPAGGAEAREANGTRPGQSAEPAASASSRPAKRSGSSRNAVQAEAVDDRSGGAGRPRKAREPSREPTREASREPERETAREPGRRSAPLRKASPTERWGTRWNK